MFFNLARQQNTYSLPYTPKSLKSPIVQHASNFFVRHVPPGRADGSPSNSERQRPNPTIQFEHRKTLKAVDQEPLDQTHTFDDGGQIYWNLYVWQGKSDCPGRADKSWAD